MAKLLGVCIGLTLALTGCSTFHVTPQMRTALDSAASEPEPTCDTSTCPDMWSFAQYWVNEHSGFKIQVLSDSIIETYSVCNAYNSGSDRWMMSIAKLPLGSGKYKVFVRTINRCGPNSAFSDRSFGGLTSKDMVAALYRYLNKGEDVFLVEKKPTKQAL